MGLANLKQMSNQWKLKEMDASIFERICNYIEKK